MKNPSVLFLKDTSSIDSILVDFIHTLPALMNLTMVAEDLSREEEELFHFILTGPFSFPGWLAGSHFTSQQKAHIKPPQLLDSSTLTRAF